MTLCNYNGNIAVAMAFNACGFHGDERVLRVWLWVQLGLAACA
jgi:hypothetical protein